MRAFTLSRSSSSRHMELKCTFYVEGWWPNNRKKYTCRVDSQPVPERKVSWFVGVHEPSERTNDDVAALWFEACSLPRLPRNLADFFANLDTLFVNGCGLKSLSGDDLARLPALRELLVVGNELAHLPDDLLAGSKQLELVTLKGNGTQSIGAKMLKKCASERLKMLDLRANPVVNAVFARESAFFPAGDDFLRISSLKRLARLLKEGGDPRASQNLLLSDVKALIGDDRFRDFTITIKCEDFKVHKFLLAARSPVLAGMMLANPQVDTLQLVDIPISVFQSLLNLIYHDELPVDDSNLVEIYAAACKLQIKGLREHSTESLMDAVSASNALEILTISAKYGDEALTARAFEEIRKMFPDKRLKSELMQQPEKLREMVVAKRSMDERVRQVREEFEKQFCGL